MRALHRWLLAGRCSERALAAEYVGVILKGEVFRLALKL